jgi:hypothetical protein
LKQHLASVLEELRQTKKVKYNIENDLAGKEVAMDIDHQTSNLKVTGPSKRVPRYYGQCYQAFMYIITLHKKYSRF